ncbi:uncharacterized protein CLUP02_09574 [Colletotrichum lupini]|uniref:Uncharacterized protein n=1 Tax=Colletotrichum lupini TaxID=145971 RepID=A0A9Q8SVQ9_9PEZI|nr:uncharacterized protein CLUP02_09574 [Colletotrichum lupini]UQC84078.1 hypothetical protein CLUP02_09574 [Colletotrichum lupini]
MYLPTCDRSKYGMEPDPSPTSAIYGADRGTQAAPFRQGNGFVRGKLASPQTSCDVALPFLGLVQAKICPCPRRQTDAKGAEPGLVERGITVVACGCRGVPASAHLILPVSAFLSVAPGMILKLPKRATFAYLHYGLGRAKVANQANRVRIITKSPRSLYGSRDNTIGMASSMAFTKWYQGVLDVQYHPACGNVALVKQGQEPSSSSQLTLQSLEAPKTYFTRNHGQRDAPAIVPSHPGFGLESGKEERNLIPATENSPFPRAIDSIIHSWDSTLIEAQRHLPNTAKPMSICIMPLP